jgi:hypothetical protein
MNLWIDVRGPFLIAGQPTMCFVRPGGVPRDDSPWFGRMRAWLLDALYPGHDVESKLWFAARVAAN